MKDYTIPALVSLVAGMIGWWVVHVGVHLYDDHNRVEILMQWAQAQQAQKAPPAPSSK